MSPEEYEHNLKVLREVARVFGLELIGWGAVPTAPAPATLDTSGEYPSWTCPHCEREQHELLILENGDQTIVASADIFEDEVTERHAYWPAYNDMIADTETIGYQCPECLGFVSPTDDVEWS